MPRTPDMKNGPVRAHRAGKSNALPLLGSEAIANEPERSTRYPSRRAPARPAASPGHLPGAASRRFSHGPPSAQPWHVRGGTEGTGVVDRGARPVGGPDVGQCSSRDGGSGPVTGIPEVVWRLYLRAD